MADSANKFQIYRQMLKLDRRSRVFTLLVEELCAGGQWEEAAEVCKKGLIFHPDHLRSRALLGWALMELGETDQSERILLSVVQDIRKNSFIFKLLSEFNVLSGNDQNAKEYAGIYEALQPREFFPKTAADEPERVEDASAQTKETMEWAEFKAAAIEELQGATADTENVEIPAQLTPAMQDEPPLSLEVILTHLTQSIEERWRGKEPLAAILSEDDRNMLRERIGAALSQR